MKRHAFWIFVLLLGLVVLLFSCDDPELCETPATVVELAEGCGLGFELSNGRQLKPVSDYGCFMVPPGHPLYRAPYVAGQKVLIGFEKNKSDISCGSAQPITIICLQALDVFEN